MFCYSIINLRLRQMYVNPEVTSSSPSSASNDFSPSHVDRYKSKGVYNCGSGEISPLPKNSHMFENCRVCSKYNCYFAHHDHEERGKATSNVGENHFENTHKLYDSEKCLRCSCVEREQENGGTRPRSAPHDNSVHNSSTSSV